MDDLDAIIQANKSCDEIVQHFTAPRQNMADKFLADLDEEAKADTDPSPLDFATLSPELCAQLHQAKEQAKFWAEREKSLVEQTKRLAGKERGLLPIGTEWAIELKETKGRSSTDYRKYIVDTMGKEALDECEAKYTETGDPTVKLSVKRIGGGR
jgi:hypothetical protein